MIKYCVYEGFDQLDSFKTLEEAKDYAQKYIKESIPYYNGEYQTNSITITKEVYKLQSFKNNIKLYRQTSKKELLKIAID